MSTVSQHQYSGRQAKGAAGLAGDRGAADATLVQPLPISPFGNDAEIIESDVGISAPEYLVNQV